MAEVVASNRIRDVAVLRLEKREDERGWFSETFRPEWLPAANEMVQANRSDSRAGVLRGLHYHLAQADYWYATAGRMFVGLYDFRSGSPTEGAVETLELRGDQPTGLYIPPGVAHGFVALEDTTMTYLVDRLFDGSDELGIRWDDPDTGITWPLAAPVLSERDRNNPILRDVPPELRPR